MMSLEDQRFSELPVLLSNAKICEVYQPATNMILRRLNHPQLCQRAVSCLLITSLVPASFEQKTSDGCQLPRPLANGYSRDGDILIGGLFSLHYEAYPDISFREAPTPIGCQTISLKVYQWLQAMVFATEAINRKANLLPNITLGFKIYDSCTTMQRSIYGTFWMLTGHMKPVPNYNCHGSRSPAAIIGDSGSTRSMLLARILGLYRIPQISYLSTSPLLSDRNQFPSFFRTIPSDDFQSRGLAQLVVHFGWTWVGLLADDNDYGQLGIQLLKQELVGSGACIAFLENIITSRPDRNSLHIVQVIKSSTAKAVVIFSSDPFVIPIMDEILRHKVTGKIWIASEAWSTSPVLSKEKYSEILSGTIGFAVHSREMEGFEEYLSNVKPFLPSSEPFIRKVWEEAYGCTEQTSPQVFDDNKTHSCNMSEKNEDTPEKYIGNTDLRITYNVYMAVHTIVLALQDLISCKEEEGLFFGRTCAEGLDFQGWQLLRYVKTLGLQKRGGVELVFDAHGNPPALYDIVNWQRGPGGSLRHVTVGSYDASAPPEKIFIINNSDVLWVNGMSQTPLSVCSPSCPFGFRKSAQEGEPICCFQCLPCPQGEFSNQTDSTVCSSCHWDQWPNKKQDHCIQKEIEFLSYQDVLGAALAAVSIFLSLMTSAILGLFIIYRNTPVVIANNRSLSYLLLLSLNLCFLCSLAFIGYPTKEKCLLRQAAFGINFAFCVSCILGKTILVVIAFNATKPNSNIKRWAGPQLHFRIVSVGALFQIILCMFWLTISPPFSQYNTYAQLGKIIIECNEGSPIAFWCMLGYLGILSTISFIVAFFARKLPDSFNEAKFITFSMLTFLSIWITFIPAYVSTHGKYMVAMEVFAILASGSALISCIFFPKCCIILLHSEMNTKQYLMGRGAYHRKKL